MSYSLQFDLTADQWYLLLQGAFRTSVFAVFGMVVGLAVGIICAIWRVNGHPALRALATVYVEFTRNTPMLVQLFIVYFGLPSLGIRLAPDTAAMVTLIFNFGAYATEIVRAGIETVPRQQIEAAQSLGLRRWEIYQHVVIVPAIERVFPSLSSQFTLLMLGSAIISTIGANELTSAANSVQAENFRSFETYLIATALYLLLALGFRALLAASARWIFPRRRAIGIAAQEVR